MLSLCISPSTAWLRRTTRPSEVRKIKSTLVATAAVLEFPNYLLRQNNAFYADINLPPHGARKMAFSMINSIRHATEWHMEPIRAFVAHSFAKNDDDVAFLKYLTQLSSMLPAFS